MKPSDLYFGLATYGVPWYCSCEMLYTCLDNVTLRVRAHQFRKHFVVVAFLVVKVVFSCYR